MDIVIWDLYLAVLDVFSHRRSLCMTFAELHINELPISGLQKRQLILAIYHALFRTRNKET